MKALTRLKKLYEFSSGHAVPVSTVTKYPIPLNALLQRIEQLYLKYPSIGNRTYKVFDLANGPQKAKKDLSKQGGIYILYNKCTGLFYVGSALRFFTNNGRLNDYYMASRVNNSLAGRSTKVSHYLAQTIQRYGIESFVLITINVDLSDSTKFTADQKLKSIEQFWMLLLPTLNKSLSATSNNWGAMPEKTRKSMSNIVYIYELINGQLDPLSLNIVYGFKELVRNGVLSVSGITYNISYEDLKGYLHSRKLWKDIFIFSTSLLNTDELTKLSINPYSETLNKSNEISPNDERSRGVWVYEYGTNNLLSYEPTVSSCLNKYDISKTHFKRVRKHGHNYKGKLFSNTKLN